MAFTVSHSTHSIGMPSELSYRLEHLGVIAVLAEDLGNSDLYSQAKDAYQELANTWYSRATAEARSKSWSNWLGGGETYNVSEPTGFDEQKKICRIYFNRLNAPQKAAALRYVVDKFNSGNLSANIMGNAYFYAQNGREISVWDHLR